MPDEWEKCPNPKCEKGKVFSGGPLALSNECKTCDGAGVVKKKKN